jgi:hypothetical protein
VARWDLANSLILFDTDSRMTGLRRDKLVFPDSEQQKLLKKHEAGVIEHLVYNFELWQKRGWPANLAHTLICGAEHLILWIYAKNKRFQPYTPKWLFYHLENGLVPEARHLSTLRRPFVASVRNATEARRTRDALVNLAERLGITVDFRSLEELFEQEDRNWHKASERTRYYLSW